ncbi:hypothetical protein LR48_Vigan01g277400 [Vigna angularis]|uniref:Uncharacterized protein n=1 Tax=Phaseolus angularis TaxID=3914 RepID=A0A0L9TRK9_PHAAN|nr:hypothetical protein LR48_Vigan01g277400 [Vigna angularis]
MTLAAATLAPFPLPFFNDGDAGRGLPPSALAYKPLLLRSSHRDETATGPLDPDLSSFLFFARGKQIPRLRSRCYSPSGRWRYRWSSPGPFPASRFLLLSYLRFCWNRCWRRCMELKVMDEGGSEFTGVGADGEWSEMMESVGCVNDDGRSVWEDGYLAVKWYMGEERWPEMKDKLAG